MKRLPGLLLLVLALLLAGARAARADAIDDQYVHIYNLIQEGDALGGQSPEAIVKYSQAQQELLRFQRMNPVWNTKVVAFRLNYLASRLPEPPTAGPGAGPGARPSLVNNPSGTTAPTNTSATPAVASRPPPAPAVKNPVSEPVPAK